MKNFLIHLLAIAMSTTLPAEIDRSKQPAAEPLPPFEFPEPSVEALPNGLRIFILPGKRQKQGFQPSNPKLRRRYRTWDHKINYILIFYRLIPMIHINS